MTQPRIVLAEPLEREASDWLAQRADLRACAADAPEWPEAIAQADGLVVRTYTRVDAALLDAGPRLRVVGRAGVGLDNIDLDACRARGVAVVHTPGANADAVAEYVFAVLLDVLRPRVFLEAPMERAAWDALRTELVAPRQLAGTTLGIIGMGRIGLRVARRAIAFGCKVLGNDLEPRPEATAAGVEMVGLDQLLARSEIVTVHVDGRASNRGLIGAAECARLADDAILINTSRGFVVDGAALASHLRSHEHARAVLDVHEREPLAPGDPLLDVPNAALSPHIAAATAGAKLRMSWVVRDVWRVLQGEEPESGAVSPVSPRRPPAARSP